MKTIQFQSHEQWLAGRKKCIGSSDSPAILGHGYADQSKMSVYADKTTDEPQRFTKATQGRLDRGKLGERFVLAMFEFETGFKVKTHDTPTICMHPSLDYVGASLDAFCEPAPSIIRPVEAKMVMNRDSWREWEGQNPPLRHAIQVQHQLWCTGLDRGYLVGWTGDKTKIFEIDRHNGFLEKLAEHLRAFWLNHVVPRIPPAVDDSAATKAAILRMFPQDQGYAVPLGTADEEIIAEIEKLKEQKKALESREAELSSRLKLKIGDASYGVCPNGRCVSWKAVPMPEHIVQARVDRRMLFPKKLPKEVPVLLASPARKSEVA